MNVEQAVTLLFNVCNAANCYRNCNEHNDSPIVKSQHERCVLLKVGHSNPSDR
jgi:hypothetical protein